LEILTHVRTMSGPPGTRFLGAFWYGRLIGYNRTGELFFILPVLSQDTV
jgi:hypothetical protein